MRISPNQSPFRVSLGDRGEMIAASDLVKKGYQILSQNYRCSLGELDIVARKGKRLFFIEVKTRKSHRFGRPEEAVGARKQQKLIQLAQYYLKEQKIKKETPIAFGVMGITYKEGSEPEIRFFEQAFEIPEDRV